MCHDKYTVLVLNKADLPQRLRLPPDIAGVACVRVSALTGHGLDTLHNKLVELAYSGTVGNADVDVAINERQNAALETAYKYLTHACHMLGLSDPFEIVSQQLRMALDSIGEVVGKTSTDDLLDKIFSTFCIGK